MSLRPQIEEALAQKMRVVDVAKLLGVTKGYVSNVKSRNDGRGRLTINEQIQIAYLWGQDWGPTEIGSKLTIHKLRVIRFLQDKGLT